MEKRPDTVKEGFIDTETRDDAPTVQGLRRIRIDEFGLLSQDGCGRIIRTKLSVPEVAALEEASENERRTKLLGGQAFDTRIELAVDREAKCLSRPLRIYYNIETGCDLKCRFCGPRDLSVTSEREPSPAQHERFLLEEIAHSGAFQVQLTGGEVFLRAERLFDTLDLCKELGLGVLLATNGLWSRIDDKAAFARRLAAYGNIVEVKVSIDGDAEFHDNVRGHAGSYTAAADTISALIDAGLPTRMNTTVFKESCEVRFIEHLVARAQELGTSLQVVPERSCGRALGCTPETLCTPEQLLRYTERANELRKERGVAIGFNFDIFGDGRMLPDYDPARPFSCGAGLWGFAITHAGEVFPCGFAIETGDRRFYAGTIQNEGDLLRIWRDSPVFYDWRHAGKSSQCLSCCHYKTTCWGGCMVQAYQVNGALCALDPYCFASLMGV